MFSRKSTMIATIFIAFMYLVFVPIVYAAKEYKITDYWSFKEGSWWEYNDGKIEITGTEEINGINTFKYVDTGSCGGGEELHLVNDDTNGFGFFSQSEDGSYSLVKLIEPYVKKGDTTTASSKDSDGKQETLVFKFEGTANVVVPAGKFKGCLRFSVKQKVVNKVENYYSYHTERFYLAKGVGLVKAVRVKESANSEDSVFGPCGFDVFNGIRELKDYSQAATGTYTASGTYTWNSTKGKITFDWTTSDFVCDGPEVGTQTVKGVTITSTTITWLEDDGSTMTWTRSGGTSGDIVGTWTTSDSETGNSWTVTYNADGTVSVTGNVGKCG